jgi:hypothetical protein
MRIFRILALDRGRSALGIGVLIGSIGALSKTRQKRRKEGINYGIMPILLD